MEDIQALNHALDISSNSLIHLFEMRCDTYFVILFNVSFLKLI